MGKTITIATRVDETHNRRLRELSRQTGLNASQILRALIENSRLEMRPFPTSRIVTQNKSAGVSAFAENV